MLVKELASFKGQREKIGSIGPHQIDLKDLPEHNRQLKRICGKEMIEKRLLNIMKAVGKILVHQSMK